jgi:hypothetical protein
MTSTILGSSVFEGTGALKERRPRRCSDGVWARGWLRSSDCFRSKSQILDEPVTRSSDGGSGLEG